jgi:predicted nucleotidyltransferase
MDTLEKVLSRSIFITRHGSHAYGTNIATSDLDFKGVCIPTKEYFLGSMKKFEQLERQVNRGAPYDTTIMSLQKFVNLASDCNPNIIEILHVADDDIFFINEFGEELRAMKDMFISTKARFTFSGYAHSQLRRIKTHRLWLLNPPKEKPERRLFGLSETSKVSKSELGAFDALMAEGKEIEMTHEILALFLREKQYAAAKENWDKYERWKTTRNEARSALEAKFGYDTKHAMHLIRLIRMCREILRDGKVLVRRPDAEELLAIRRGEWTYDQVVDHAEALELECGELYKTSKLPREANRLAIDDIVVSMTERYLRL